jgi:fibronectin type 3 domain-containing protein
MVTVGADLNGHVLLLWDPIPVATRFEVRRFLDEFSATPTATSATLSPTATPVAVLLASGALQFSDPNVTNGRRYRYEVTTWDSLGTSVPASIWVVPFANPTTISTVSVYTTYSNSVSVSWEDDSTTFPVVYYEVYRCAWTPSPTFTPTVMNTLTATQTPTATPTGTLSPTSTFTPPPQLSVATLMASSPEPYATVAVPYFLDSTVATPGPQAFYYWVRAVDSGVDGQGVAHPNSSGFASQTSNSVLPISKAPAIPSLSLLAGPSVTPQVGSNGFGVRLVWNGSVSGEDVLSYTVFRNAAPLTTLSASVTTFDDLTMDGGDLSYQRAFYALVASDASGSVTSQPVTMTLSRSRVSGSLVVTPDATTGVVNLTWGNAVTGLYGLSGYAVFRSSTGIPAGTGTITPTPIAVVSTNPSQTATPYYVDQPVTNAHGSSYWVAAVDGVSWVGPKATAQPATLLLAPTPPSSLTANGPVGNHRVQLSWNMGTPGFYGSLVAYRVYRQVSVVTGTPTPVAVATVSSAVTQYMDVVADSAATTVVYQVAAIDALGNASDLTSPSNAVTLPAVVSPTALVTPSAPGPVTVTGNDTSLVFSWPLAPTPDLVTGYRLFGSSWAQATAGTPTPTPIATIAVSGSLAVTQSGLSLFQVVVNYLVADNAAGSSASATLSGIPVPTYQVQAVVPVAMRAVSVSWNLMTPTPGSTPGVDGFHVYRSFSSGSGYESLAFVDAAQSSYVDTNVPAGVTAYYIVTAKSGDLAESPMFPTQVPAPRGQAQTWPNVPSAVTVLCGYSSATISWSPNAVGETVTSYWVYHDGATSPLATVFPSPSPSYVSVETPGARSVYQVSAVNASGEGVECVAVTVLAAPAMTPQIGFTPPAGEIATPGYVWLSGLTYSLDVAGYDIYRGFYATPSVTPQETQVATLTNPTSFVSDPGQVGYTTYYRVVARDASGLEASHASSAYLSIGMPPGSPLSLTTNASSSSVSLVWAAPSGDAPVTGYAVYREATAEATKTLIGFSSSPTPQFVDSSVSSDNVYYYSVAALNGTGEGVTTSETGVLALAGPTVQVTPNASSNTIVWVPIQPTATPPFYGYAIYRAQSPASTFTYLGLVAANASTPNVYVDSSVSSGMAYVYQVAPSTSTGVLGGFSVLSSPITVLPQAVTLSASTGWNPTPSGWPFATISWNYQKVTGTTYQVQRHMGTETDTAFQTIATGVTGTDYVDSGLTSKSLYVYRVITVSTAGLTVASANIRVLPAKAPVVTGTVTGNPIEQGVSLFWTAANPGGLDEQNQYPLAGYRIYRSLDNGGTYRLMGSCAVTTFLDQVDILSGESRTYQVRAYDNPPDEPDMFHETTYPAVRVDSLTADTALDRNAIRPFGSTQERTVNVRFAVTQNGNVSIKVYSISGVLVKELLHDSFDKGIHWTSWDATNSNGQRVASGVYLITTIMPNRKEVCKVAVIK